MQREKSMHDCDSVIIRKFDMLQWKIRQTIMRDADWLDTEA